jgi:phage tail-like protein
MARAAVTDPIRNFKFKVQIIPGGTALGGDNFMGGQINLGFSVVSGLTVQNEMIAYREGGMNTHPHKMIGQSDYGPVTFTKGVFADQDNLYKWQQFLHSWGQGGLEASEGSTSDDNDYRCDIVVAVYDHPVSAGSYAQPNAKGENANTTTPAGDIKLGYKLFNCWPASFSLGDLNAGDSSILIQQMVINHEGFQILFGDEVKDFSSLAKLS